RVLRRPRRHALPGREPPPAPRAPRCGRAAPLPAVPRRTRADGLERARDGLATARARSPERVAGAEAEDARDVRVELACAGGREPAPSLGRTTAFTCGLSSVEVAAEPRPGKCLVHQPSPVAARPRPNASPMLARRNSRAPSGPSGESRTGARSTPTPARRSAIPVARPAASACASLVYAAAGRAGGRSRQAR